MRMLPSCLLSCLRGILFLGLGISLQAATEGTDLEFGGPGKEAGQFAQFRDLTFDDKGNLYTLEGVGWDDKSKTYYGNGRVQKFDTTGKLLLQFPIVDLTKEKQDVRHLAVDAIGNVYVTQTDADLVLIFGPDGKPLHHVALPYANAIARWKHGKQDGIVMLPWTHRVVKGTQGRDWENRDLGGEDFVTVSATGELGTPIKLPVTLNHVADLAAGPDGSLYAVSDVNQIRRFDAEGKLLATIGAGEGTRADDGSELIHSVAIDSKGFIYTYTWGNPSLLVRFSPDLKEVRRRQGWFKWGDPWGTHSNYTPLAIGPDDRVWSASTAEHSGNGQVSAPCVFRTDPSFFKEGVRGVMITSALQVGFKPHIQSTLPAGIAYDLNPIPFTVMVEKGQRRITEVTVTWRTRDMYATEVGSGKMTMPLVDGAEARAPFSFTPPAYGWYMISCTFASGDVQMTSQAAFIGVTRRYPNMVEVSAEALGGGGTDPIRTAFSGLMNQRLHVSNDPGRLKNLDAEIEACNKAGLTSFVQLTSRGDCEPANVRAIVEHCKGRVKVWEIMNEPNFGVGPKDYAKLLKDASKVIREIDPAAKIMAPDVCGIDLGWHEAFYKEDVAAAFDILSVHDYEGHETIDPDHWRWKYAVLRELMTKYGDAKKPIWQTERAISSLRGDDWQGSAQAIRTGLHRDLLETLGIPPEHNNHFYTSDHGFGDCPSWVWSGTGPNPAALALRVRHAMTHERTYAGTLDFGPVGARLLLALRYTGSDGTTAISLRNLGSLDLPLTFAVTGGSSVDVVDAFGNTSSIPVTDGHIEMVARQMATFMLLKKGQNVTPPNLDFGRNLAPMATITCDAAGGQNTDRLHNGIYETINAGNPNGSTDGNAVWATDDLLKPVTIDLAFAQPLPISAIVIDGLHADNGFCSLRDYEWQWLDGKVWKTIETVSVPIPPSERCTTTGSIGNQWSLDHNVFLHRFKPVQTDHLRLIVRRVTQGFLPDDTLRAWGNLIKQRLFLREIEVYCQDSPIRGTVTATTAEITATPVPVHGTISAANTGSATSVLATIVPPPGWKVEPRTLTLALPAQGRAEGAYTLTPTDIITVGKYPIAVQFTTDGAHLDLAWANLEVISPVTLAPLPPPSLDAQKQPLAITLTNPGQLPMSGTLRLELAGPHAVTPIEQTFGPIAAGGHLVVTSVVPHVTLLSESWQATWTVTADHRRVSVGQNLAVRMWQVLGPFANEFDTDFGPETKLNLKQVSKDRLGNEISWHTATMDAKGYLDLTSQFTQHDNVSAYVVAWVRVAKGGDAQLSFGTDDGSKVWVNGKQVHAENSGHGATPGQFREPVTVRAGWNSVLFKVCQGGGGWGIFCDLAKSDGTSMPDVTWSPMPQ